MNRTTNLRVFVWTGFSPDYTAGLAFAIARDESDAREQIKQEHGYDPLTWGTLKIYPVTRRMARSVSGGG